MSLTSITSPMTTAPLMLCFSANDFESNLTWGRSMKLVWIIVSGRDYLDWTKFKLRMPKFAKISTCINYPLLSFFFYFLVFWAIPGSVLRDHFYKSQRTIWDSRD